MTTFTVRGPLDLIAIVPWSLGFHPRESIVLLTFGRPEAFHARVDLPADRPDRHLVISRLVDAVRHNGLSRVALVYYSDRADLVRQVHEEMSLAMDEVGAEVLDGVRVTGDRFHPADDPAHSGTPFDLSSHPFTADQVFRGRRVHADREEVRRTLDPADPDRRTAVARAADAAADGLLALARRDGRVRDAGLAEEAGWLRGVVADATRGDDAGSTRLPEDVAARVLVLVVLGDFRDVVMSGLTRENATHQVDLWRDLVTVAPDDLVAGPAALLALAAWVAGDGALAWCAIDRSETHEPSHPLAAIVREALERAAPPSLWRPPPESALEVFDRVNRRRAG